MSNSTSIVPASVPPDGVTPDFDNLEDVYYTGNLVNLAVCAGLINVVFLMHAYVKLVVRRARLLHEDWFCIAAWVFVNGFYAMNFGMSHFGEGRNIWQLSLGDYQGLLKFMYISTTLYTPAAFCTKVTLLLLISRVFSVHRIVSKLIHLFIVLILLAYLPIAFLKIFICRPITAYWDNFETTDGGAVTGGNSNCRGQATLFMGDISISIITDVLILILPIVMSWRMEATWRQKLKIMVLLGAGGAATVTTVVRAYFNVQFMHTTNASKDFALSSITS
ncbi:hypothetical protein N0V93_005148 [Gnomoniopsis smithogilvyi]|uniref:Rhodopsin domain-containing protein n=1 Tax=Gnomoniopsis smithogilvyi TaxID=1191159 RepID=A0A9W8YU11_9PEZI|nr:hypothetical protein N0V93_005148 [Gnomoniopsis smithogilvyi]